MKRLLVLVWVALVVAGCSFCGGANDSSLKGPGTIFIRQKADHFTAYWKDFLGQTQNLKAHGFSGYCLERDLFDPHTYILLLKCSDLGKGIGFIRSPEYMAAIDDSNARVPELWYGLDHNTRTFVDQSKMTGGMVIARNEVRNYPFWLKCFYAEDGGKHNHPGRHYKNSDYSIHYLLTDPNVAIVAHEASDVSEAPPFMISDPLKNEMESTGVTSLQVWYGINMQEANF